LSKVFSADRRRFLLASRRSPALPVLPPASRRQHSLSATPATSSRLQPTFWGVTAVRPQWE